MGLELDARRIREAKRDPVANTLQQTGGNYAEAAKLLRIHPNNLHRLVHNLKLRDDQRSTFCNHA